MWNGGVAMIIHTLYLPLKVPQPCDILKSWTDKGVTPTLTYPRLEASIDDSYSSKASSRQGNS